MAKLRRIPDSLLVIAVQANAKHNAIARLPKHVAAISNLLIRYACFRMVSRHQSESVQGSHPTIIMIASGVLYWIQSFFACDPYHCQRTQVIAIRISGITKRGQRTKRRAATGEHHATGDANAVM